MYFASKVQSLVSSNNNCPKYFVDLMEVIKSSILKSGYTLEGWYTESDFKNKWDFETQENWKKRRQLGDSEKEDQKGRGKREKYCRNDVSVFLINGVYRGGGKVYNGELAISKSWFLALFDIASYWKGEILHAYLFF